MSNYMPVDLGPSEVFTLLDPETVRLQFPALSATGMAEAVPSIWISTPHRLTRYFSEYGTNTDPTDAPSHSFTMIGAQKPAQSVAALHRPLAVAIRVSRKQ